jgi:hypothetical protein
VIIKQCNYVPKLKGCSSAYKKENILSLTLGYSPFVVHLRIKYAE